MLCFPYNHISSLKFWQYLLLRLNEIFRSGSIWNKLSLFVPKYGVEWAIEYFVLIMSNRLSCTFVKGKPFIFLGLSEISIQLVVDPRVYKIIIPSPLSVTLTQIYRLFHDSMIQIHYRVFAHIYMYNQQYSGMK